MYDIITIGDSFIDTFLILQDHQANVYLKKQKKLLSLNYGEKIAIDESHIDIGGNACNVAVGSATLGLNTAILTELGDDINAHLIKKRLKDSGVDTKYVVQHENEETAYSIILNYHSERTILSRHPERDYSMPEFPKTKWVYYTSMGKGFVPFQEELQKLLAERGDIKFAMNPGSYQFTKGLRSLKRIMKHSDLFICNKDEAMKLVKKTNSPISLLKQLNAIHAGITVMTDGTNGSYATDGEIFWKMKPYPFTPVSATGAGDAYASGFLAAIVKGKGIELAMQWGTANAGHVVQGYGAQDGLCSEYKIKKTIGAYPEIIPEVLR